MFFATTFCFFTLFMNFGNDKSLGYSALFINSYDNNMVWPKNIYNGLSDSLSNGTHFKIFYEFMDSKDFNNEVLFENFYKYIQNKYSQKDISIIFCSDNNAFDFLLMYHKELFPNIPVVFCGVNDFDENSIISHTEFTGIAEVPSIKETLQLSLKLHPKTKNIFIVNDYLKTGIAWKKQFQQAVESIPKNINVTYSENLPIDSLVKKISTLSSDTIVFLGVFYSDLNNFSSTYEHMAESLASKSNVPFYVVVRFNIQNNVLGGKVIDGYSQGVAIGKIGLKILNGVKPVDIKVGQKEYNEYVFNYKELERFNISLFNLPEGSTIINRPFSIFETYKNIILFIILIFVILTVCIIILIINIGIRKETELTLRDLANATWEGILIHQKGNVIQINETFTFIFGYTLNELKEVNIIEKIFTPEYVQFVTNKILEGCLEHYEAWGKKKNGVIFPVEVRVREIDFNGNESRVIAIRDLSDKKKSENEYNYLLSLWDNMFENSLEGIFIFNNEYTIQRVNKSFCKITGYPKGEVVGQSISIFKIGI